MRCCEEQCEAVQVRKEKMYRLSGTRKRQRSKCYKGRTKERKTVTPDNEPIPTFQFNWPPDNIGHMESDS